MEIIQLGSIYFDGEPFLIGSKYTGENLSIGNTVQGKEISWINVNGLLVANHAVCVKISWDDLNKQGFIFGKKVTINGTPYFCRSLKVGNDDNIPNEWDDILDATSEDDSLWHWKKVFFWGQETSKHNEEYRAHRGYDSAHSWDDFPASLRGASLGFRPALEPLVPESLISDPLIGTTVNAHGCGGTISGILTGFTDYDLFLSPTIGRTQISDHPWCCQQENGIVIVDRSAVTITKQI